MGGGQYNPNRFFFSDIDEGYFGGSATNRMHHRRSVTDGFACATATAPHGHTTAPILGCNRYYRSVARIRLTFCVDEDLSTRVITDICYSSK
jgi:hypothetical protein